MNNFQLKPIICLILLSATFFSCEKEKKHRIGIQSVSPDFVVIPGANVRIFNNKNNYLINQNPVFEGTTDSKGEYITEAAEGVYFYRVKKDSLNEVRFEDNASNNIRISKREDSKFSTNYLKVRLSTTPVRVQLKVFDNGVPVPDAYVQFFISESDFKLGKTAPFAQKFKYDGVTDANGEILMTQLEPREYWFEVIKGNKDNGSTVFKTDGKLEDNPDITNVYTVGLQ